MPIQKDGKTYYTMEEVSQRLDKSIEKEAQNLLKRHQSKMLFSTKYPLNYQ